MPYRRSLPVLLPFLLLVGISGCSDAEPEPATTEAPTPPGAEGPSDAEPTPDTEPAPTDPAASSPGGTVHEYGHLEDRVRFVLGFLKGESSLLPDMLADSVILIVAPEGGGGRTTVSRDDLQTREAWRVGAHTLVPTAGLDHVRLTPGLHGSCEPVDLGTRFPDFASLPHVGAMLAPAEGASCLQAWSATFVFDENAESARLIAVAYDQWEW